MSITQYPATSAIHVATLGDVRRRDFKVTVAVNGVNRHPQGPAASLPCRRTPTLRVTLRRRRFTAVQRKIGRIQSAPTLSRIRADTKEQANGRGKRTSRRWYRARTRPCTHAFKSHGSRWRRRAFSPRSGPRSPARGRTYCCAFKGQCTTGTRRAAHENSSPPPRTAYRRWCTLHCCRC